jgi:hypothetical protein
MDADERRLREERRLRRAAVTAATQQPPPVEDEPEETDEDAARARRSEQRTLWLDMKVRQAIERGDFDNLPGAGKPLPGLDGNHDPDWWLKKLIAREQITGVLPPALQLRKDDAELDARLDQETTEGVVRHLVDDFNGRVVEARRQLMGGPPVITPTRDVDTEVDRWRARRAARRDRLRRERVAQSAQQEQGQRTRWWRRSRPS